MTIKMNRRSMLAIIPTFALTACVSGDDLKNQGNDSPESNSSSLASDPLELIFAQYEKMHEVIYNSSESDISSQRTKLNGLLNDYGVSGDDSINQFVSSMSDKDADELLSKLKDIDFVTKDFYLFENNLNSRDGILVIASAIRYEYRTKVVASDYVVKDFRRDDYTTVDEYVDESSREAIRVIYPSADLYQVSNDNRKSGLLDPSNRPTAEWVNNGSEWVISAKLQSNIIKASNF